MSDSIICVVDIETDGPLIGTNSMLSFAAAAFNGDGGEIASFSRNLHPLENGQADPRVAAWWQTQPDAWAEITRSPKAPAEAMADFAAWVRGLGGERLFAAYPLVFDAPWIDWYLRKFADATLCDPFRPGALFSGTGIDIPTYVQTVMGLAHTTRRADYPAEILTKSATPHLPLSDVRGHAGLLFAARRKAGL